MLVKGPQDDQRELIVTIGSRSLLLMHMILCLDDFTNIQVKNNIDVFYLFFYSPELFGHWCTGVYVKADYLPVH